MSNQNIYLGKKGYTIYKNQLDNKELKNIRKELNVRPFIPNSIIQVESYPIYRESHEKIYLPRYYGIENFGLPNEVRIHKGKSINTNFTGNLFDYQENIVNKYLNHVKDRGGLLDVDPGKGKTVMALYILSKLKVKTLVIVHKTFLLNQWIERINQFLPEAKVGKIQGPTIDIDNKDIVIGMLQSLSTKDYSSDQFDDFGLSIYDEVHHLSAEVFSKCMMKIMTNYTLGLSGTMQRKDGLSKVFKMFFGEIVHKEKNKNNYSVLVKQINYKVDDEDFNEINMIIEEILNIVQ